MIGVGRVGQEVLFKGRFSDAVAEKNECLDLSGQSEVIDENTGVKLLMSENDDFANCVHAVSTIKCKSSELRADRLGPVLMAYEKLQWRIVLSLFLGTVPLLSARTWVNHGLTEVVFQQPPVWGRDRPHHHLPKGAPL